jgi:hypothetical protein
MPARKKCGAHGDGGSRNADGDQKDEDRGHHDGNSRVHDDAQRAVVGGAFLRVNMRHLNDGQNREQRQAHHRRSGYPAILTAAPAWYEAALCVKTGQKSYDPLPLRYTG